MLFNNLLSIKRNSPLRGSRASCKHFYKNISKQFDAGKQNPTGKQFKQSTVDRVAVDQFEAGILEEYLKTLPSIHLVNISTEKSRLPHRVVEHHHLLMD